MSHSYQRVISNQLESGHPAALSKSELSVFEIMMQYGLTESKWELYIE